MKYLKHMTNCAQDPKIQGLMAEFGHHGYAAYWLILERIAAEFDGIDHMESLTLPSKNWQKICGFSPKKFRIFLDYSGQNQIFSHFFNGAYLTIKVDKLLKYADEYTQKRVSAMGANVGTNSRQVDDFSSSSRSPSPKKNTNYSDSNTGGLAVVLPFHDGAEPNAK